MSFVERVIKLIDGTVITDRIPSDLYISMAERNLLPSVVSAGETQRAAGAASSTGNVPVASSVFGAPVEGYDDDDLFNPRYGQPTSMPTGSAFDFNKPRGDAHGSSAGVHNPGLHPENSARVKLQGLNLTTRKGYLERMLKQHLGVEEFADIFVPRGEGENSNKGFAYVSFKSVEEALANIDKFKGLQIDDHHISVKWEKERQRPEF